MRFLETSERLKILISLSNQLWIDLNNDDITEEEYAVKIEKIRIEINTEANSTFIELQNLASNLGYVVIKQKNAFNPISNFVISKN